MPRVARVSRFRVLAAAALAAVSADRISFADDTHDCVVASTQGQELRDAHRLRQAGATFARCARDVCPDVIRKACLEWGADIETLLPTVVFAARDNAGHDVLAVRVRVDGELATAKLDGAPVAVDPGPHVVRFESEGAAAVEQSLIVHEGEKNRLVSATLGTTLVVVPSGTAQRSVLPSTAPSRRMPLVTWVLGGVGVVALGGFAYFGLTGLSEHNDLQGSCALAQTCDPSRVNTMKTNLLVADVALGVGILSLAGSIAFAVWGRPETQVAIEVAPVRGGSVATWRGSF